MGTLLKTGCLVSGRQKYDTGILEGQTCQVLVPRLIRRSSTLQVQRMISHIQKYPRASEASYWLVLLSRWNTVLAVQCSLKQALTAPVGFTADWPNYSGLLRYWLAKKYIIFCKEAKPVHWSSVDWQVDGRCSHWPANGWHVGMNCVAEVRELPAQAKVQTNSP